MRAKVPDQEEGSQGSLPGRGDFLTETCKGMRRHPGNLPSTGVYGAVDREGVL